MHTMKDITLTQLMQLCEALGQTQCRQTQAQDVGFFEIGKPYFIRTVTHHYTGRLMEVGDKDLLMEDVAWIADDGRFQSALAKSEFHEVEMYPPKSKVIIGRSAILDAVVIEKLPTSQK